MTSDGRKGLCNDVLVERIPCGVHVGGRGGLAQECTTCTGKQTILVLIALHHFLPLLSFTFVNRT